MRIGLLGTPRTLAPTVRPELAAELPPGTVLSGWPSRVGVFPATPVELALQAVGHLEAGLRAARAGVDAVVIDSVADYGLDALVAGLGVPVAGAGQAGLAAVARTGRFAIVTVWPPAMNFALHGQLTRYGLRDQCLAIDNLADDAVLDGTAAPGGYLREIDAAEAPIVGRVLAAIDRAVAAGARAVMLGCTCMSAMAARVGAAAPVPVISPMLEGVRAALALARPGGPEGAPVRTGRAALVQRMVEAIADEADESCPVCAADDA